jgi:hypothetical protein
MEMRRYLALICLAALACHTDSAVAPVIPPAENDAKNMAVGEVRILTPSQIPNGIELSAGTSDYIIVVANTNPTPDVLASYVVKGDLLADNMSRSDALSPLNMLVAADDRPDAQEVADARVRAWERAHLSPANASRSVTSAARNSLGISPIVATNVGQQVTIKVPDENSTDLCAHFITTTGTVKSVSRRAAIVMDNTADQTAFSTSDFDAIAAEFDNVVYPTDSSYFGKPTDMDANGHVILYYTPEVNKLTQRGQSSFIGGFFFAGDFFDPTKTVSQGGCPQSNQGEIFYLLAPDPSGSFSTVRTAATVRQGTRGTVAHEFQHMINAGNRILSKAPSLETVWLDEGLAHTAEDANGRVVRGFTDFQTLSDGDLFVSGNQTIIDAYNAFFIQNLRRFATWLARPDTSSGISEHADANLSSRGAIWSLIRWSGDHFSNGDFRAYTRKLAAGPDTGVRNITGVTAQPLDTLLSGWMVSNYSDHLGISNLAAKYNYVGYNMRSAVAGANSGTYPLLVTTLASGASISTSALSGSGTYYRVAVPAGSTRTIKIQDSSGANVSFTGAHFFVLRID